MEITIAPYIVEPSCDCPYESVGMDRELHNKDFHLPITYWGVFLGENKVSATSSREQAERTREWMENWLAGAH